MDLWSTGWWDDAKQWLEYGFHDEFSINVDLGSPNEVGTCKDTIWFCKDTIWFCREKFFLENLLNSYLESCLRNYWRLYSKERLTDKVCYVG
jgi:hypothetical protein